MLDLGLGCLKYLLSGHLEKEFTTPGLDNR